MTCFLMTVLVCVLGIVGGLGTLVWFAYQRVRDHVHNHPEAAKQLADHLIIPILAGKTEAKETKADVKKVKGTLI